jgi:hypothetical protein
MKILVVIANYGLEQIQYLKQIVQEFQSYPMEVDIIVNTDVYVDIEGIKNNVLKLENTYQYPLSCWRTILEHKDKYDLYIFNENDILIKYQTIDFWLECTKSLPIDCITGFIRIELDELCDLSYPENVQFPDMHQMNNPWVWDSESVFVHNGVSYAQFTNIHQGCFVLNNEHLNYVTSKIDMNDLDTKYTQNYGIQERANADIFALFRKKIIPISHFDKIWIHHLPNRFAKLGPTHWQRGVDYKFMKSQIDYLIFLAKHWEINEEFLTSNPQYLIENHNKGIN